MVKYGRSGKNWKQLDMSNYLTNLDVKHPKVELDFYFFMCYTLIVKSKEGFGNDELL